MLLLLLGAEASFLFVVVEIDVLEEPMLSTTAAEVEGLGDKVEDATPLAVFGALVDACSLICVASAKYGAVGVVGVNAPPLVNGAEYSWPGVIPAVMLPLLLLEPC